MKRLGKIALFLLLQLTSFFCLSADQNFPSMGLVYNTKEMSSKVYDCSRKTSLTIECKLTATSVRHEKNEKDLKASLKQAESDYKTEISSLDCLKEKSSYADLKAILENRKKAPNGADLSKMSPRKRQDSLQMANEVIDLCKAPTLDNYKKFLSSQIRRQINTCLVSSHSSTMEYSIVEDYSNGKKTVWAAKSEPHGSCGIVMLDRFESDEVRPNITFWKYIAKKHISNPSGSDFFGSCSILDMNEYIYDWKKDAEYSGCDYIKFSPI